MKSRIFVFLCSLCLLAVACGVEVELPTKQPTPYEAKIKHFHVLAVPTPPPFPLAVIVNSGGLNVRACPSTSCRVLAVLIDGQAVTLRGAVWSVNGEDWQKIEVDVLIGYVDPKYLQTGK